MSRTKTDAKVCRFRVPLQDTSVHEWLEAQSNISLSLRMLIKKDIGANGISDIMFRSVEAEMARPAEQVERPQVAVQPTQAAYQPPQNPNTVAQQARPAVAMEDSNSTSDAIMSMLN